MMRNVLSYKFNKKEKKRTIFENSKILKVVIILLSYLKVVIILSSYFVQVHSPRNCEDTIFFTIKLET
jgi:hypothetical protein